MLQGKQILFIIVALVILGSGALIGYGTGIEKGKQDEVKKQNDMVTKFTLLPRSESITFWRTAFGGIAKATTSLSITIENGEETSEFVFAKDVTVERNFVKDGRVVNTVKELSVNDIKEGEAINVGLVASPDGNITVEKIVIVTPQ